MGLLEFIEMSFRYRVVDLGVLHRSVALALHGSVQLPESDRLVLIFSPTNYTCC